MVQAQTLMLYERNIKSKIHVPENFTYMNLMVKCCDSFQFMISKYDQFKTTASINEPQI